MLAYTWLALLSAFGWVQCNRDAVLLLEIRLSEVDIDAIGMHIEFLNVDSMTAMNFTLRPAPRITSPHLQVHIVNETGTHQLQTAVKWCHYRCIDAELMAIFNNCEDQLWHGFLQTSDLSVEIRPITPSIISALQLRPDQIAGITHIAYNEKIPTIEPRQMAPIPRAGLAQTKEIRATIELAMFFDAAAYRVFAPHYNRDADRLRDMILAYVNAVQSLFHHPTLGSRIDLVVVYLEIMQAQPVEIPHYRGERIKLLDSFCDYQRKKNPAGDADPGHWDMAVYISALDFHSYESGRWNGATMGLATVAGVCLDRYACVIAEFGSTNAFGRPYPSAGFTSVYILAHEMGHNLGMHHDSFGNSCPARGHVMSSTRGTNGDTTWSECSADVVADLGWASCLFDLPGPAAPSRDAWKFRGFPGLMITAKKQCELLLIDSDAIVAPTGAQLSNICQNLQCRTPHRDGYFFAGPALTGTKCAAGMWCDTGSCVRMQRLEEPIAPAEHAGGGWSDWQVDECESGCLTDSKGYQRRRRQCTNSVEGCEGSGFDVVGCNDDKLCIRAHRRTPDQYATYRCSEFSKFIPELDPSGSGLQALHEEQRLWMGCAIFCKRRDSAAYYAPRLELNAAGRDAYFPDGTLCHRDASQSYYCLQHHCLPDNFHLNKLGLPAWMMNADDDVQLVGNAGFEIPDSQELREYFSVDANRQPLRTQLEAGDLKRWLAGAGDWVGGGDVVVDDDYVELPAAEMMKYERV